MKEHVIFITSYCGRFNGRDYKERGGIYGSELACINIATRLAHWYDVTVFVTDDVDLVEDKVRYVRWGDYNKVCYERMPDICVVSRFINFFIYNTNYAKKTYVWSHDTFVHPMYDGKALKDQGSHLLKNLLPTIERIICVGDEQRKDFYIKGNQIPEEKLCTIPNGIILDDRMILNKLLKNKVPNSFVYCSCPKQRHLNILLRIFPKITELLPDATLSIYYSELPDDCKELAKDQPNVIWKGKVAQDKLMKILQRTEYWVYPTKFFETCCTVSYETGYHGCLQITSEVGALIENVKGKGITIPGDSEKWEFEEKLLGVIKYLRDNPLEKRKIVERTWRWAKEQTWDSRAYVWKNLFEKGHANYIIPNSIQAYMVCEEGGLEETIVDSSICKKINLPKQAMLLPNERKRYIVNKEWPYAHATVHCMWLRSIKEFLNSRDKYIALVQYGELSSFFNKNCYDIIAHMQKRNMRCCFVKGGSGNNKQLDFKKTVDPELINSKVSIVLDRQGASRLHKLISNAGFTDYMWDMCYELFGKNVCMTTSNFLKLKIITNKTYYKKCFPAPFTVGVGIMMKDEEKSIMLSLNSVRDYVDSLIFYDTGSTDRTIEICEQFCKENKIQMHLKTGTFVDFAVSRNVLMRFADDKVTYLLMLDSADELRNGEGMLQHFLENPDKTGFYTKQNWVVGNGRGIEYENIRIVKTGYQWLYKYPVHEYITGPYCKESLVGTMKDVKIFQDRTLDQGKSKKRWERDKVVLLKELRKNNKDPRVLFYLGQTYRCLDMYEQAYRTFLRRMELQNGFHDENQQCYIEIYNISKLIPDKVRASDIREKLVELWEKYTRGEGAFFLGREYSHDKNYEEAYKWTKKVCELPFPNHIRLWVDMKIYSHHRWQQLATVALHLGQSELEEGFKALKIALKDEPSAKGSVHLKQEYEKKGFHF